MKKLQFSLLFFLFAFSFITAQDYSITSCAIDIRVFEEGYFDVVEQYDVFFYQSRRGIFRTIPYEYKIDGKRYKISIEDFKVKDHQFKQYRENKNEILRIGDPDVYLRGAQRYEISYRVRGAFLENEDYQEFYWNVVGKEWDSEFESVYFTIYFPETEDITEYKLFAGNRRSDHGKVLLRQEGNMLIGESLKTLKKNEGVSVAVKMPVGTVTIEKPRSGSSSGVGTDQIKEERDTLYDWLAAIPAAMIAFFLNFWRRNGKDNYVFEPMEGVAYAPESMSAAEAGSRIDFRVNNRDLYALIPQWGREGYIRITGPYERSRFKNVDLFVERLKGLPHQFPEHEHIMFKALFEDKDIVLLSSLENKFYKHFAKAKKSLKRDLRLKDSYDEQSYALFHSGWFLFGAFAGVGLGILLMISMSLWFGLTMILFGLILGFIHFSAPRKKEEAIKLQQELKDFKRFLEKGPEEKFREVVEKDPNYFDNVFPYVVAFGIDKLFVKRMEPYMEYGPSWYYYGDHMGQSQRAPFSTFTDQFKVHSVSSAFTSQPGTSGSGSGTSFSSGSSGGGFGGGGGGSW